MGQYQIRMLIERPPIERTDVVEAESEEADE